MTKENIFKDFIEDPAFFEKGYLPKEKLEKLRFIDQTGDKLIEVIKIAINSSFDGESEIISSRKINQYLNR
jgi:hypothetical protein